ncbi:MAG: alginate lyase family protein [Nocardioides sp.]
MSRDVGWYVRRLRRMSAGELVGRARDVAHRRAWAPRQVRVGEDGGSVPGVLTSPRGPVALPAGTRESVSAEVVAEVVAAADRLLAGEWRVLGVDRPDIVSPDWFLDPVTGRRAPDDVLAFRIDHRDEAATGNVKAVWELSRHHHLTVLAAAFWLTEDERYADVVDDQLRSWWAANPFLSGVHWTSGIELGVRLVSWAWVRRFLDAWPKVGDLFETNEDAVRQIWWHQQYLERFPSRGSSANNHAVAEDAGRLVAACAFPWFAESDDWRGDAAVRLSRHFLENTWADGLNRELATDYHRFVTELVTVAAVEAAAAGDDLSPEVWERLTAGFDAAAAVLDVAGNPPRQGDGDEGRALVVDVPDEASWTGLLSWGSSVVESQPWWPATRPSVVAAALRGMLGGPRTAEHRATARPRSFASAGMTILSTDPGRGPEIWCRCDGGPLGFLSIAAHGHADALSVEVRHDGVDVLVDPGTYCYHGEPAWRSYFRSTRAHNTLELDGTSQAIEGGPFMWTTEVPVELLTQAEGVEDAEVTTWAARHRGYERLPGSPAHERTVSLDATRRRLVIADRVRSGGTGHDVRLHFHMGPDVQVDLRASTAALSWPGRDGTPHQALMDLPNGLRWTQHRGQTDPPLGWYSRRFGVREPITTLVGAGRSSEVPLTTALTFDTHESKAGSCG